MPVSLQLPRTQEVVRAVDGPPATFGGALLHSSLDAHELAALIRTRNGLISTLANAYDWGQSVVVTPDQLWHCIVLIVAKYLLATYGEEGEGGGGGGGGGGFRGRLVRHAHGSVPVVVRTGASRVEFPVVVHRFMEKLHKLVVDPALQDWFLCDFSTTEVGDSAISASLFMAMLQPFFTYHVEGCVPLGSWSACTSSAAQQPPQPQQPQPQPQQQRAFSCSNPRAPPALVLGGVREDYAAMLARLARMPAHFGRSATLRRLQGMLTPVVQNVMDSFDSADGHPFEPTVNFWTRMVYGHGGRGDGDKLTGWLMALGAIDDRGEDNIRAKPASVCGGATHGGRLCYVNTRDVPGGTVDAALQLQLVAGEAPRMATLTVGSLGYLVFETVPGSGLGDALAPAVGWLLLDAST